MSTKWPSLRIISFLLFFGILFNSIPTQGFAHEAIPRVKYLDYAEKAADYTWQNYHSIIQHWKDRFDPDNVFGYRPPGGLLEMAVIYAYLHKQKNNPEYAERSKKILLTYADFRNAYPEWAKQKRPDYEEGVPVLPDFFTVMRFIRAYDTLRESGAFNTKEDQKIQTDISDGRRSQAC